MLLLEQYCLHSRNIKGLQDLPLKKESENRYSVVPTPDGRFWGVWPTPNNCKTFGVLEEPVACVQNLRLLRQNLSQRLRRREKVWAQRGWLWVFLLS